MHQMKPDGFATRESLLRNHCDNDIVGCAFGRVENHWTFEGLEFRENQRTGAQRVFTAHFNNHAVEYLKCLKK